MTEFPASNLAPITVHVSPGESTRSVANAIHLTGVGVIAGSSQAFAPNGAVMVRPRLAVPDPVAILASIPGVDRVIPHPDFAR